MPWTRVLAACALGLLLLAAGAAPADPQEEAARRASHLLDYIAVDYAEAVRHGEVVSELEYAEQLEFVGEVDGQLGRLGLAEADPLRERLGQLLAVSRARGSAAAVAAQAGGLSASIRERFEVRALPPRTPDLERGRGLYTATCASCHGTAGRGDGPAGVGLDPAPTDFTDLVRARQLSPLTLYGTISFGIAGTGMIGFAETLSEADRHDLAFYVGSLAFAPRAVERGRATAERAPERIARWLPDFAALVHTPAGQLADDPEGRDVVAFLRVHPEFLVAGQAPLALARRELARSWSALARGDAERAMDHAIMAYLEGFELVEPALDAVDRELRMAIELDFSRYRSLLRGRAPQGEVRAVYASLGGHLDEAARSLEGGRLGPSAVFLGSLTILAREGLEALLIVLALCAVLIRAERREALRYVHAGWGAALVAGGATWLAAQELVRVSGAQREVVEGVTSLLAVVILFYVSYWLISKLQAARWQAFIDDKVRTALSRGSLWTLAAVSFIAVYREILETVLFYQALWVQAGPAGARPLLLGIASGAALLALVATLMLRFGLRLPIQHFFSVSSALLYTLAIVLAGKGISALQEANWLPTTLISELRLEWVGVYGTLEGLAVQGLLVVAALATVPYLLSERRRGRFAAEGGP
ncbi:MAG: cytochrome c/FTR1 family iron permease [Myxococcota bacterium]